MTNIISTIITAIENASIETYVGGKGNNCRSYQVSFSKDNQHFQAVLINIIGESSSVIYMFTGPEEEYLVLDKIYQVDTFDKETLKTKVIEYFGEKAGKKYIGFRKYNAYQEYISRCRYAKKVGTKEKRIFAEPVPF